MVLKVPGPKSGFLKCQVLVLKVPGPKSVDGLFEN